MLLAGPGPSLQVGKRIEVTRHGVYWKSDDGTVDLGGVRGVVLGLNSGDLLDSGDLLVRLDVFPTIPSLLMPPGFLRPLDLIELVGELSE